MYHYLEKCTFKVLLQNFFVFKKEPDTTNAETVSPILQPFTSSEEKSPVHNQVGKKYCIILFKNNIFIKRKNIFSTYIL